MRAEVSCFHWNDLERDRAAGTEPTSTLLEFTAAPVGQPGGENYQVTVCTPAALADLLAQFDVVMGCHYLFVSTLRTDLVEGFIQDRLRRLDGDDWNQLAAKIALIGSWEFEGYTE